VRKVKLFAVWAAALLILAALTFSMVNGCSRPEGKEIKDNDSQVKASDSQAQVSDGQIRNTVIKYNETLPLAYAGETAILKSVATEREMQRVELFKVQLAEENKVIRVNPVSLEVNEIERNPSGEVCVQALEIWEYRHLDSAALKPLGQWSKIRYKAVYRLVSSDKGWLVDSIDFEEELVN